MSDGAWIAAVALVAVIISLVLTEREPIKKANKMVNAEIIKKTYVFSRSVAPSSSGDC